MTKCFSPESHLDHDHHADLSLLIQLGIWSIFVMISSYLSNLRGPYFFMEKILRHEVLPPHLFCPHFSCNWKWWIRTSQSDGDSTASPQDCDVKEQPLWDSLGGNNSSPSISCPSIDALIAKTGMYQANRHAWCRGAVAFPPSPQRSTSERMFYQPSKQEGNERPFEAICLN